METISVKTLKSKGACPDSIKFFKRIFPESEFPNGVRVTRKNLEYFIKKFYRLRTTYETTRHIESGEGWGDYSLEQQADRFYLLFYKKIIKGKKYD